MKEPSTPPKDWSFVMKEIRMISLAIFFLLVACSPKTSLYQKPGVNIYSKSIGLVEINGYESQTAEGKIAEQFLLKGIKIVERSRIITILREQGLQYSGAVDISTAVKIGKIIGVDAVFIGNLSQPTVSNTANLKDNTWSSYTITFTGRIIDVETGEILLSGSASGKRGYPNYAMLDAIDKFFKEVL